LIFIEKLVAHLIFIIETNTTKVQFNLIIRGALCQSVCLKAQDESYFGLVHACLCGFAFIRLCGYSIFRLDPLILIHWLSLYSTCGC